LTDVLNKLIGESEQMRSFLAALKEQYDREGSSSYFDVQGEGPIIKDIEDFLNRQRRGG
jgi:hypothetical protein